MEDKLIICALSSRCTILVSKLIVCLTSFLVNLLHSIARLRPWKRPLNLCNYVIWIVENRWTNKLIVNMFHKVIFESKYLTLNIFEGNRSEYLWGIWFKFEHAYFWLKHDYMIHVCSFIVLNKLIIKLYVFLSC